MNPLLIPAADVTPFKRLDAAPIAELPQAPPSNRAGLWDEGNRHKTLLAIGAGLLGGRNFAEGMAQAGQNVMSLGDRLQTLSRKQREFGGPDGAFEIITDPETGERTVREVTAFKDYLDHKRVKAKDTADINGRAMFALAQLPPEQREAAYNMMRANPAQYGIDPSTMPAHYDPNYVAMAGQMGMTVAQAQTRQRADEDAKNREDYRAKVQQDREKRTAIYENRSAATTRQGDERIGIARAREGRQAAGGAGKKPKVSSGNLDLSYLLSK